MKILVVFCHPVETSFCAALHSRVIRALGVAGHDVDDCDLYAEGFDPVLSREARLAYHDSPGNRDSVAGHVERLLAAQALVLVYPVWNFGFPAMLKGYFDCVFLPGVSFNMVDGKVEPSLTNLRRIAAVTTYGGARFRAMLMGDPPRKIVNRLLNATAPNARVSYHALYDMNRADSDRRNRFLESVGAAMERL